MRAFTSILVLSMLVTACGSDDNQNSGNSPKNETEDSISRPAVEPEQKEIVVEYHKDGADLALALEDTKDLPACDRSNERQLAFIKKTEQFFACTDGTWAEVPVKGKDGSGGAKGDSGAQGPVGPQGPKGDDGKPVSPNEWFDPMTQDRWLLASATTQAVLDHYPPCSDGWRLGTREEVRAAVQHGLSLASVALGGAASIWTADTEADVTEPERFRRFYVSSTGSDAQGLWFPQAVTSAGIACLSVTEGN